MSPLNLYLLMYVCMYFTSIVIMLYIYIYTMYLCVFKSLQSIVWCWTFKVSLYFYYLNIRKEHRFIALNSEQSKMYYYTQTTQMCRNLWVRVAQFVCVLCSFCGLVCVVCVVCVVLSMIFVWTFMYFVWPFLYFVQKCLVFMSGHKASHNTKHMKKLIYRIISKNNTKPFLQYS